jgi:Amt family ammonium transporter
MQDTNIDTLWILISAALVFSMQGGFLCLESGLTRSKNAINVALKNMTDFTVAITLFWMFGFAVMFGATRFGWIGASDFFVPFESGPELSTFFLFQAMFCATASTIVSGAVAERMRFSAYIVVTIIVSGLIYPVVGHWAWGGAFQGEAGWLANLGFVDFAGSTVVHSVGGWAALAAVLVIGPRVGRFRKDREAEDIPGSNLPFAMLGVVLLTFGWVGFNGGSTLALNESVPKIICNTFLAAAASTIAALVIGWIRSGYADVKTTINGLLAGLVAITACCHAVSAIDAALIGLASALVVEAMQRFLERLQIDDAIGVVPVHVAAGVWGTLAVAIFGDLQILDTGLSRWSQLGVQALGIGVAFLVTFTFTYFALRLVNIWMPLRVTEEEEHLGLNIVEHGASTEVFGLLWEMEEQRRSGDFDQHVSVQPHTEVGAIAAQYNRVLEVVVARTEEAAQANEGLAAARDDEIAARQRLEQTIAELERFNQLAVGREDRMIELKREINELAEQLGDSRRYPLDFETSNDDRQHEVTA